MKIGDKVKCVCETSTNYGQIAIVTDICGDTIYVKYSDGDEGKGKSKYYKLTTENPINKVSGKIMSLKESFLTGMLSEPMKSYRKAGITNGDNLLTEDGVKVFLSYLLSKEPLEGGFKTEVVDGIIADMKDSKECK